jgi:hypothetical protein
MSLRAVSIREIKKPGIFISGLIQLFSNFIFNSGLTRPDGWLKYDGCDDGLYL